MLLQQLRTEISSHLTIGNWVLPITIRYCFFQTLPGMTHIKLQKIKTTL